MLMIRSPRATHRIATIIRLWTLGGRRWAFGCRCGHDTKGYQRPEDALEVIDEHIYAATAREKKVERVGA